MAQVLCRLPKTFDENLIVGVDTSDDAAVYKISEEVAVIETLDFFTPVVDDPYTFGQIAAANSLSDVYAMGAEPKLAMNIVCFPNCLDKGVLEEILRGSYDKVKEAGAITVGGHTVQDDEPKFGLSVTGFIHPSKVLANCTARIGDRLILTKPLGVGIINTAIKGRIVSKKAYEKAVFLMTLLNKYAKEAIDEVGGVHALTDITGFGLIGHSLEMAEGSGVTISIDTKRVGIIEEAKEYAEMGLVPKGAYDNRSFVGDKVFFENTVSEMLRDFLFDPQTSGGLLMSIEKEKAEPMMKALKKRGVPASDCGEVLKKTDNFIVVR